MIYYLFAMLDDFSRALDGFFIFFLFLGLGLSFLHSAFASAEKDLPVVRVHKSLYVAMFILLLNTLLPNTKQAAFIFIAPKIIENKDVQATVSNIPELTQLGTEFLKQKLKGALENGKGGQAS